MEEIDAKKVISLLVELYCEQYGLELEELNITKKQEQENAG